MANPLEQSRTVGVVIPAYNEATYLMQVLMTVCITEGIQQIVVVDDGSKDATFEIAQRTAEHDERVTVIRLLQNQGKAAAMLAGVQALDTELVIFLDADLVGLQPVHLQQLANIPMCGSCDMSIALFHNGRFLTDMSHRITPHLTGQRCLRRLEAEQALTPLVATRYGVETGLTIYAKRRHWNIKSIYWAGVTHSMREEKRKVIRGIYSRWQMYSQIVTVIARNGYSDRRWFVRRRFGKNIAKPLRR